MKVFDKGKSSRVYVVMELLKGRPLRLLLSEEKKLSEERAVNITVALCGALDYIHSIDFGIASLAGSRRLTFGQLSQVMHTGLHLSGTSNWKTRG